MVLWFIRNRIDWRKLSGVEMTWLLYPMFVDTLPETRLREFFTAVEDWDSLRRLDQGAFAKESDL